MCYNNYIPFTDPSIKEMTMESSVNNAFPTTEGDWIKFDAITSCTRVPSGDPQEDDAYTVSYLSAGSDAPQQAWVSYTTYCAMRPHERAYLTSLNSSVDAHE